MERRKEKLFLVLSEQVPGSENLGFCIHSVIIKDRIKKKEDTKNLLLELL